MRLPLWMMALLLLSQATIAAVGVLPEGAQLVVPDRLAIPRAQVAADASAVVAFVLRGQSDAALQRLRGIHDPLRFEAASTAVIDQLQQQPPGAAADSVLAALAQEPVRLYRRHEETAGDWFVPLFDVPGRAASARVLLARIGERDRLVPKLRRGDPRPLLAAEADPAALVAAIDLLAEHEAAALASEALDGAGELAPGAWSALARRSPRPATLDAVLRFERPDQAVALLQQLPATLSPSAAMAWLGQALEFDAYRSTAVAAIGREAARSPVAEAKLGELLAAADGVTGASAAAALARLPAGLRAAQYDRLLAKGGDPRLLARVVLALRLDDTPAARERLQRVKDDPRLPDSVRAELQP